MGTAWISPFGPPGPTGERADGGFLDGGRGDLVPTIDIRYTRPVIRSIADKATRDVYDGVNSRHARKLPRELHGKARRLLDQINAAPTLDVLRVPPSNRLEKLKGDRAGCFSLRINDQWRVVFRWQGHDALDVEITDYHG